jgi:ribosome-associated heat shock protein Hsp15
MAENNEPRADKFLWSVRIYKTRALSTEACKKGRITVDDIALKPSRIIKTGEIISVSKPPVIYRYHVNAIPHSRLSAKLVPEYITDVTSPEVLKNLKLADSFFIKRDRGAGRPTKKERRNMDKLTGI